MGIDRLVISLFLCPLLIDNLKKQMATPVYAQYNSENFRVAWKRFPVKEKMSVPKFYAGKAYCEDEETGSENLFFLSHFCLSGSAKMKNYAPDCSISSCQNSLFLQKDKTIEICIEKNQDEEYSLFEYSFSEKYFLENFIEDSSTLRSLLAKFEYDSLAWTGSNLSTSPVMGCLIHDMMHSPFTGKMHEMYLTCKMTQLFLLQVKGFDFPKPACRLLPCDEERIRFVKAYIDTHVGKELELMQLSRLAGINQTKMKGGFKQLFGSPVHAYIIEQRMNMAYHLLSAGHDSISAIAEKIGYSDVSHFSNAFKQRFGFSPSVLRK